MRFPACLLAACLTSACSPDYNWREIRPEGDGFAVTLPGKPAVMTRSVRLDAHEVSMTMHGARVGEVAFTAAVAKLPADDAGTRERVLAAMQAGMLQNIGATGGRRQNGELELKDPAGAVLARVPVVRLEASGTTQGAPVTMLAGFAAHGSRAWQWMVIGPQPDREHAATFLDSFRLVPSGS